MKRKATRKPGTRQAQPRARYRQQIGSNTLTRIRHAIEAEAARTGYSMSYVITANLARAFGVDLPDGYEYRGTERAFQLAVNAAVREINRRHPEGTVLRIVGGSKR